MRTSNCMGVRLRVFLTIILAIALSGIQPFSANAADYTWTGDAGASWHALHRLDPPDPELYINNFGIIGNPPVFPGMNDNISIAAGFTNPSVYEDDVSINALTLSGELTIINPTYMHIYSNVVNNGSGLKAYDAGIIAFHGNSFVNDGLTKLYYGGMYGGGFLVFYEDCTITGTGSILVETGQMRTENTAVVTNSAGHTIRGGLNSYLDANLINNGLIRSESALYFFQLGAEPIQNNAVIAATNESYLLLAGTPLTQSATGQLMSDNAFVRLTGSAVIDGGSLETANGGFIEATGSITNTIRNITNNGDLRVSDGALMLVTGSGMTNNGTVSILYGGMYGGGILRFMEDGLLGGTGTVIVETGELSTSGVNTLTNGPDHTIRGGSNSQIQADMINNGTIRSDTSGYNFTLSLRDITNNNEIIAENSSTLWLTGMTVTQSESGSIKADNASVRFGDNSAVSGGSLETANNGYFEGNGVVNFTVSDLENNGDLRVRDGGHLMVTGSELVNNGTVSVLYGGMYGGGILEWHESGAISGTGSLVVETGVVSTVDGVMLTNAPGHTIRGGSNSYYRADTINNGTIRSDYNGYFFQFDSCTITNNSMITSANSSTMILTDITLNQSPTGELQAYDNGLVRLAGGAVINGGVLSTATGGTIGSTGQIVNTISDLTNTGTVRAGDGATLAVTGDNLINDGVIQIHYGGMYGGGFLRIDDNVTIDGSGEIRIESGQISTANGSVLQNGINHTISGINTISVALDNLGTVEAEGGTLNVTGAITQFSGTTLTGGTWIARTNSSLNVTGGNDITTNGAVVILDGTGSQFGRINALQQNSGSFNLMNGRSFTTAGNLQNSGAILSDTSCTLSITGDYTAIGDSDTVVNGQLSATQTSTIHGTISGNGHAGGVLVIGADGVIAPGSSVGTLTVDDLTMETDAVYKWEIDAAGSDLVTVSGDLDFGDSAALEVVDLQAVTPAGDYVLFEVSGDIAPLPEWTINLPDGWYTDGVEVQGSQVVLTNLRIATPTPTPTNTPTPTPTEPSTPTPTPTPTMGPGQADIELNLNQTAFQGGDTMILTLSLAVGPTDIDSMVFIVLELLGHFYFMPAFGETATSLYTGVLPAGLLIEDATLMELPFPSGQLPSIGGVWHGAVLTAANQALVDYDFIVFTLY